MEHEGHDDQEAEQEHPLEPSEGRACSEELGDL
jgi:hypothetical protein